MFEAMLFDKFIDLEFRTKDKTVETIKTSVTGMKPAIKFSWSRVPGQFTYKCRLEVTNWFTNTAWYDFDSVKVTAGYMYVKGRTTTFECQIFNSYKPTAGPDTSAVFECIVASAEARLMTDVAYTLNYYDTGATVEDACKACAQKLGLQLIANASVTGLLQKPFSDSIIEDSFDTGYQLVNYISTRLSDLVKEKGEQVNVVVFDKYLAVLHFTKDNEIVPSQDDLKKINTLDADIPIIDQTTDVTWTSGTLSVTAPWNPAVTPGKLIYCNPSTYTGSTALPNIVARSGIHKDPTNCYYVVTQQCSFATNGSSNEMKLLCVRMSNSPMSSLLTMQNMATLLDDSAKAELNAYIKSVEASYKSEDKVKIEIGKSEPADVQAAWKQNWSTASTPKLLNTTDNLALLASNYYKDTVECVWKGSKWSFPASDLGYVLIPLATYQQYLKTKDKKWEINPNAPADLICDSSHFVMIPTISNYATLNKNTQVAEMLEQRSEELSKQGQKSWATRLKTIAEVVKEGTLK